MGWKFISSIFRSVGILISCLETLGCCVNRVELQELILRGMSCLEFDGVLDQGPRDREAETGTQAVFLYSVARCVRHW